jgi:hypothetical protein
MWSSTSEKLAVNDYLNEIDYEIKLDTYLPEQLPEMAQWLENDPLVNSTDFLYTNLAFFNAESKSSLYRFFPLDNQEDNSNPVSLTSIGIFNKTTIKRIAPQFKVEGNFSINEGEILLSRYQANYLENEVYHYPIEPGMTLNLSVALRSPDAGIYLFQYELIHFYNWTIKGIYDVDPQSTLLQKTYSTDFLTDSIFILQENLENRHYEKLESHGITPLVFVKCKPEILASEGIANVVPTLSNLIERFKIAYPAGQTIQLETPFNEMQKIYTNATNSIALLVPVLIIGSLLSIVNINIILEKRYEDLEIMRRNGASKIQIILTIFLEIILLTLVAFILSSIASIFIASVIPYFGTLTFSEGVLGSFLSFLKFPLSLAIFILLGAIGLFLIVISVKIMNILKDNMEERDYLYQQRLQKRVALISIAIVLVGLLSYFSYKLVLFSKETISIDNYNSQHAANSAQLYWIYSIIIILITVLIGYGINVLFGKIKKGYLLIFGNNGFFINNNFSQKKNSLKSVFLVLLVTCTVAISSLTLVNIVWNNSQQEQYYNNGSDFRIRTSYIDGSFSNNISEIEGIDQVMEVYSSSGRLSNMIMNVYGIDPIIYAEIGRWAETSFSKETIAPEYHNYDYEDWLYELNSSENNIIISEAIADKFEVTIDDEIVIGSLPNISANNRFTICGIIHSSPGLGLATGANLEMNQKLDVFVLVKDSYLRNNHNVEKVNLFFANSDSEKEEKEQTIFELQQMEEVIEVNPAIINEDLSISFVDKYLPESTTFLLIQALGTTFIGAIISIEMVGFTLMKRKKNYAILSTLGNTPFRTFIIIEEELTVIGLSVLFFSLILGLSSALLGMFISKPLFTSHEIIPFKYKIPYGLIFILLFGIVLLIQLFALPEIKKINDQKVADTLYST